MRRRPLSPQSAHKRRCAEYCLAYFTVNSDPCLLHSYLAKSAGDFLATRLCVSYVLAICGRLAGRVVLTMLAFCNATWGQFEWVVESR